jgi:CheY-like chemotaxis protein
VSGPPRILVVDNNLADQEMIGEMLPAHGLADLEMRQMVDGHEAIALLRAVVAGREPAPDVVLLDLHLAGVHGRDILAFMRGEPALRLVPVIIFTTGAGADVRQACLALGADEFLVKPRSLAGFSDVAAAIRRQLDGSRRRSDTV